MFMKTSLKSFKLWHLQVGCNLYYFYMIYFNAVGKKAPNKANFKNVVVEGSFDNGDSLFTGRQQRRTSCCEN